MNDDTELCLERIDAKYESRDTEGALSDLDEAIRNDPQNAAYYRARGTIKYNEDYHEDAIVDFTFFLDHTSDIDEKEEIYWKRAISREHLHQYREQLSDLTWLIDNGFDEKDYFFDWRCECERKLGLFEEAIRDFSFAIDKRKSNKLLLGRAETYLKMGNFNSAFEDLAQVLDAHDNYLIKHAQLYYQMRGYTEAVKDFTVLIDRNENANFRSAMHHWRGKCYYQLHEYQEALQDFTNALKLREERGFHAGSYHWRAKCYYHLNELQHSISDYKEMQLLLEEEQFLDEKQYIEALEGFCPYF